MRHADGAVAALVVATCCLCCASDPETPTGPTTASSAATGGDGGAGAAGGHGGQGGATGGGGPASGSGGVSPDACNKLCDKLEAFDCYAPYACLSTCENWVERSGACAPQMLAEIDCIADSTTECGQDVCQAEYAALDACAEGVDCFVGEGKGYSDADGYTCVEQVGCSTGQLKTDCARVGDGPVNCDCFIGGEKVGSCVNAIDNCQIDYCCCNQFW